MDGITDSMDLSLSKLQETVKHREVCHAIVRGAAKESDMTEGLNKNNDEQGLTIPQFPFSA